VNFLIPELVEQIHFRKGPYYADVGDFGSVGAAHLETSKTLQHSLLQTEGGLYGYARGLWAASPQVGEGSLLHAVEYQHEDGPWQTPANFNKANALVHYSREQDGTGWDVISMGYFGRWNSTDQIPRRAVDSGLLDRFGAIDPTDGGESKRFSLSGNWHRDTGQSHSQISVYGVYYDLSLFSNFTYFLDDPVRGDQFQQQDQRGYGGLMAHQTWEHDLFRVPSLTTAGLQVRGDAARVDLNHTQRREWLETVRSDDVGQVSLAPYLQNQIRWTDRIRTESGIRLDHQRFENRPQDQPRGDSAQETLISPKGSLILGPWERTEWNISAGMGFHSNDARGVTAPSDPATPLVRTHGAETGLRTLALDPLQSTLTFWWLDSEQELVFVGDAGNTEATRPSQRYGIELSHDYAPKDWLDLDLTYAWSHARYSDSSPDGNAIPGAIESVVSTGCTLHDVPGLGGFFAGVRGRYFGPRPLTEDGAQWSNGTAILNLQVGYRFNPHWKLTADLFNALDTRADDITYYYPSRLPGEPAGGIADHHFHPVEPIQARIALTARF
jgi:outer membrane receptor protein involved in Fe transport